ncbi:MAG: hypothetical protein Q8O43_02655 [Dehalococcoidia bacterium]|nr:hypothetical protein [Dehalococcoidia bacterium]
MAAASLIIGVLVVLSFLTRGSIWSPFGGRIVALAASVLGMVLGIIALKRKSLPKMAVAGIVLNSIGVLMVLIPLLVAIIVWSTFA